MEKQFQGLYVSTITCFDAQGEIDEKALKEHLEFLLQHDVAGTVCCADTGAVINLAEEEYRRVAKSVVEHVNNRVPVIVGSSLQSTTGTIERSLFAKSIGAAGVMVVPPYYQNLNKREVYEHFKAVSKAVTIPIILYNNPGSSGVDVQPELIAQMVQEGIVCYVKESQGDPERIQRIVELTHGEITVFYGDDINALGAFVQGATGWISGLANIAPDSWKKVLALCTEDNYREAKELWHKLLPLVNLICLNNKGERANWMGSIKEALNLMGRKVGQPRRPMLPLEEIERNKLKNVLLEVGILKE